MSEKVVLAGDTGGTQMRAALVDGSGRILTRRSAPTPADDKAPRALIDLIRSVGSEAKRSIGHAVVGLPGVVDYDSGRLLWAPNLPKSWPGSLSSVELAHHLGLRVHVANDADLAAVGEAVFGAGAGCANVAYLTISTGIGAGVVHACRLVRGTRSLAEVGHTIIDWEAWREGRPGTLEELGSGSGVARLAREVGLGDLDARTVHERAVAGDERAAAIWEDALGACAAGVTSLVLSFYPTKVVIGGGLGSQPEVFARVRDLVMSHPEHLPDDLEIVPSSLRDDAALVGAAGWVAASGASD
jgi:glucokinase